MPMVKKENPQLPRRKKTLVIIRKKVLGCCYNSVQHLNTTEQVLQNLEGKQL